MVGHLSVSQAQSLLMHMSTSIQQYYLYVAQDNVRFSLRFWVRFHQVSKLLRPTLSHTSPNHLPMLVMFSIFFFNRNDQQILTSKTGLNRTFSPKKVALLKTAGNENPTAECPHKIGVKSYSSRKWGLRYKADMPPAGPRRRAMKIYL